MRLGPGTDPKSLHQAIAERAYANWENEGKPDRDDWAHWFKAELEVAKLEAVSAKSRNAKRTGKPVPTKKKKASKR
jgi:hypothetical protein